MSAVEEGVCECGAPFLRDEPWKKLCILCQRAAKTAEPKPANIDIADKVAQLRRELQDAKGMISLLKKALGTRTDTAEMTKLRRELQAARGTIAALEHTLSLDKNRPASALMIPAEQMKRLLQLCHPDKHDGSQAANEATRWLLSLRQ